jgi:hypothetical protein
MSVATIVSGFVSSIKRGIQSVVPSPKQNFVQGTAPVPQSSDAPSVFDSGQYVSQKYNDIYHTVDMYLDNSGDFNKPQRYFINPAAVLGLSISDTVNDWIVDGSITLLYLPEGPPPDNVDTTGQQRDTATQGVIDAAVQNGKVLKSYTFRGDGFDILRIMIVPDVKRIDNTDESGLDIGKNNTKWMLSYAFSVIDVEDVNDVPEIQGNAATYMKCLKLRFHDVRYQMLLTTNMEYSTAMPKDGSLRPDFNTNIGKKIGVLHTGDIIRDMFNHALAKPDQGGLEEFKIQPDPNPKWDQGDSELFYTSPAQYNAYDDIEYVYSHHVSKQELKGLDDIRVNDMCLLHTDRADKFGQLEPIVLTPLAEMFKQAGKLKDAPGELQKEHFFVTALTQQAPDASMLYRAPVGPLHDTIDLKMDRYGQIISYSFVDMSPIVNSRSFSTTPVYSVDIGKRQFNVEFRGNDVESVKKVISKTYISELFKNDGSDDEKLFLPVLHKSKRDLNIFPVFSTNGTNKTVRQRNGLHTLMYTGLFQNACICFKVYGLTWRESGTFIGIDKTTGCADNDYNNKLYGQWFVVRVDHVFEAGAYLNIIYAVKLHRYKELETKFNNTFDSDNVA